MTREQEKVFWGLKKLGIQSIPEYKPFKERKYRVDLAILLQDGIKIAIEIDGAVHDIYPEVREHDSIRDEFFEQNAWRVIRFSNDEVNESFSNVLAVIEAAINGSLHEKVQKIEKKLDLVLEKLSSISLEQDVQKLQMKKKNNDTFSLWDKLRIGMESQLIENPKIGHNEFVRSDRYDDKKNY